MELSVVIPVHNEHSNIAPLVAELRAALDGKIDYEIVYVDDGSSDGTLQALQQMQEGDGRLRVVRHQSACGQSTAIYSGVRAARAPCIATLDGDGQNDPADVPSLFAEYQRVGGADLLVAGYRRRRQDTWLRRWSSRIANAVRRGLLHDGTPDTGCGLKVFARELFLRLPYFDHMHRFLPALVQRAGGKVVSVEVNHRPRERGRSKYGVHNRLWVGLIDLMGVRWLQRRSRLPVIEAND